MTCVGQGYISSLGRLFSSGLRSTCVPRKRVNLCYERFSPRRSTAVLSSASKIKYQTAYCRTWDRIYYHILVEMDIQSIETGEYIQRGRTQHTVTGYPSTAAARQRSRILFIILEQLYSHLVDASSKCRDYIPRYFASKTCIDNQ